MIDFISESVVKMALSSEFDVIVWTDRGLRGLSAFSDENITQALKHISEALSIGGRFFCEVNNRDAEVLRYGGGAGSLRRASLPQMATRRDS